jgi:hypothetical protein
MLSTTLFVTNLCEFVQDYELSQLFQKSSILHSLPSSVVRKPDTQSLQYGFVSFPTVAEKEVRSEMRKSVESMLFPWFEVFLQHCHFVVITGSHYSF